MVPAPRRLRVEHLDAPLGLDVPRPRLSWQIAPPARRQLAYRIRAGGWDSGWVDSEQCVLVPYGGPALGSRERIEWRVQVRTDAGTSPWSAPASWEMGLTHASDWTAQWISPVEADPRPPAGARPASLLRATFTLPDPGSSARVSATAHGIYELFLNGERVGDEELTPGFTSYRSRVQVQTYDVGPLLRGGENELRAVLSDGWYRGKVGFTRAHDVFGDRLALLAQLEIDGAVVAATDAHWVCAPSAIRAADLIDGESVDQRVHEDDLTWESVEVVDGDFGVLGASPAPPVRRTETIRPVRVTTIGPARHVVDLGQNINGWVRLADPGPAGTELTLTHGEALDEHGDVTQEHLGAMDFVTQTPLPLGQIDRVVSDGTHTPFEPRHTTHGFRYVRIEGHPGPLTEADVDGIVVHTDLRRTGWFASSDARLNQLHHAADWSFRTNACDIPTDCPQRERAGWTGDWQLFLPTAAFLYDVAGFSTKWLRDLAADQRADGAVRNFAPDPAPPDADASEVKTFLEGSSGWGDAAVLVPWETWRAYGDRRLLEEQWPSMVAWVDYVTTAAREKRHPTREARRATPEPHERFLWDTGWHWGEWTEPDRAEDDHFANFVDRDFAIVATAFFAWTAGRLAAMARILDRPESAQRYGELAADVRAAWQREFVADDGTVRSDRQADVVRALAFELVAEGTRATVAEQLVGMVRAAGTHLNTGFLATPYLLPVLADAGHLDVAYELLFQDTPPSWLTMVDRGATTIWEHWEGIDVDGVARASLNHYSKGAVVSFLHRYVAGIQLLDGGPAYARFRIAPRPGGGLTWVSAAHESPYGRIESSWWAGPAGTTFVVTVPPNTEAVVSLPDGREIDIGPGRATFLVPAR
jgi:alpha-L-rhamnosidase